MPILETDYSTLQPLDVADLMDRLDDDHPATLQPLNPFSISTTPGAA